MTKIKISQISKSFFSIPLFKKINFEVNGGEVFCLFGPSGCGKTTLLKIISGIIKPDNGTIFFYNNHILTSKTNLRISYVFQEPRILNWETVAKNISIVMNHDKHQNGYYEIEVNSVLSMVQLKNYRNRYPDSLSAGQQQRVSLARALIIHPDILLMDEPFSHLDDITATNLRVDISNIFSTNKTTVIFATHNPLEAIFLADQIAVMSNTRPSTIKKIIHINIPKPRNKNLYQEFIFQNKTKVFIEKLLHLLKNDI